jgi:uncharacterized membrane protein YeiH
LVVNEHILMNTLLVAFDLGGTFVFALSGATAGVKHRLDLFGVLVLAFAAGNSGGITRDAMIGAVPPAAISDWRYVAVSILAGLITFYWYRIINRLSSPVLVFDAAGLALFAVAGAGKALAFHASPVAAMLLGMLTGIGGGMARDVLVREIPTVLRTELYAVAALVGAAVVVLEGCSISRLPRRLPPAQSSALDSDLWPCGAAGSFRSRAHPNNRTQKRTRIDQTDNKLADPLT